MDMETFVRITEGTLQLAFGALIPAVGAWFFLRNMNQRITRENRRIQILEEVAFQVATITYTFAKYSTLMQESSQQNERWLATRNRELDQISQELSAEFKRLADAQSKLLMLGEKNLERSLRVFGASMSAYTRQVNAASRNLTADQINHLKQPIQQAREHFYSVLSRKYDRLLANA